MEEYYLSQAGHGLPYFEGVKYQRGNGFFGRLLKGGIIPILKYFGTKLFDGGMNIAKDVAHGESIKGAAKKTIQNTVGDIAGDIFEKVTHQKGRGIKRRSNKRHCGKIKKRKITRKPIKRRRKNKKLDFLI